MKHLIIVLLALATVGCSNSQEDSIPSPKIEVDKDGNSLLWMITSEDLKDTSFLFGTMHMIQKDYFIFPEQLTSIAASADVFVMELAGLPDPFEAMKYVMLPAGESMFDYFSKEQTDTLMHWIRDNTEMSKKSFMSAYGKMKPFALLQLTALSGFEGETKSYEEEFTTIATDGKIKIIGLETIGDQMKIFDDLSKEETAEMVMSSIREGEDEAAKMIKEMQTIYRDQLIDSLYAFIHSQGGLLIEKENEFLSDRNNNWIPKISKIIKKQRAFIAVGAGHLGGEEGVIKLLEKAGYTITPVQL